MIKSDNSTIWTELDFDKPGKQVGRLHLPYSVTRSAYGHIDIPLAIIANGAGLAMSTLDVVNQVGGTAANFLTSHFLNLQGLAAID